MRREIALPNRAERAGRRMGRRSRFGTAGVQARTSVRTSSRATTSRERPGPAPAVRGAELAGVWGGGRL